MLMMRKEVVVALLSDREWSRRLERATSTCEVDKVVIDFCRAKGIEVGEVPLK